jgi:hypothetical protein
MAGSSLKAWFASSDNKLLLNQLRQAGITCCQEDPTAGSFVPDDQADEQAPAEAQQAGASAGLPAGAGQPQPLQGLTICITGTIADPRFENRKEMEAYITKLGGTFKNSLAQSTNWLVVSSVVHRSLDHHRCCCSCGPIRRLSCASKQCLSLPGPHLDTSSMFSFVMEGVRCTPHLSAILPRLLRWDARLD